MAKGSQRRGELLDKAAAGPGGRQVEVKEGPVWGDYACGDVVMLHSFTTHQGWDNLSSDRLRFSRDFRYQPKSHPVRVDSLIPHMNWLTRDEICQDWDSGRPVRYYWQDWDLEIVERA